MPTLPDIPKFLFCEPDPDDAEGGSHGEWGMRFEGVIHSLEAGLSFARHLHNGDPLSARTVQVPRGRPLADEPPFTWEQSAADALTMEGITDVKGWTVPEWPSQYGGGGLSREEAKVLSEEMRRIKARSPLSSFGIWMLGPALLKFGT